jgi:hypothetical protein
VLNSVRRFAPAIALAGAALVLAGCYASIAISPATLPETVVGQTYSVTLTAAASDHSEVVSMSVAKALPPGLSFKFERGVGGTLSGTPTATGTYTINVVADGLKFNFGGPHGERSYTLVIH